MSRRLEACWLGRVGYRRATALQEKIRAEVLEQRAGDMVLLLEHPHVFTLGRNAQADDVIAGREWLEQQGVQVIESDRGGQVTYHGPGQLVGYPIVDLKPDRRDLRRYVRELQQSLVATVAAYDIEAAGGESESIGVWVEDDRSRRKIASIGIHMKRWVTTHGFALNVTTDLSYFEGIVACGMTDVQLTSIERETGRALPVPAVARTAAEALAQTLDRSLSWVDETEVLARTSLVASASSA